MVRERKTHDITIIYFFHFYLQQRRFPHLLFFVLILSARKRG